MKKILILCLCVWVAPLAAAQKFPVRPVAKPSVNPSLIGIRHVTSLRAAGLNDIAAGLELRYTQAVVQQAHVTAPTLASQTSRTWLEQKQRDFKAWQLKRQRRKRDEKQRQEETVRLEHETLLATLPGLNTQHTFQVTHFTDLATDQTPPAKLPLVAEEGVLYRGMALPCDGEALKNILQNGLRIEDLGSHATTKLLAISGGMRGNVSAARPAINLTSFPEQALYWATQRAKNEKKLLVIVGVNGIQQSGEIVLYSDKIPAAQITHVLVPLMIHETAVWCKVELTEDHNFAVTPYDIPSTLNRE